MLKGFKEFLFRGNLVDLAVAVAIGTAFTALIKVFTDTIINPILATIGGSNGVGWSYQILDDNPKTLLDFGTLIGGFITFAITAAVIYFILVVPMKKINELRDKGKEPEAPAEVTPEDVALLREIRDLLSAQKP
ncbi:large-conductance mechanosensitive channel protein MscL [soil metagenome]